MTQPVTHHVGGTGVAGGTSTTKATTALQAAAMIKAGVQPDLLGEIYWAHTEELWKHALYALVIHISGAAERSGRSVAEVCARVGRSPWRPCRALPLSVRDRAVLPQGSPGYV